MAQRQKSVELKGGEITQTMHEKRMQLYFLKMDKECELFGSSFNTRFI